MPRLRLPATLVAVAGLGVPASAQTPEDYLARKPAFADVQVSTPTAQELASCRVEPVAVAKPATQLRVVDGQGRLLRQVYDTTGAGRPNMTSYYFNGVESFQELDVSGNGKPDRFRWLGVNGGKWGSDTDEDGVIDVWYVLTPSELGQELFAALRANDPKRLAALTVTAADLAPFELPDAEVKKILAGASGVAKRFAEASAALAVGPAARWVHAEVPVPHVTTAESLRAKADLVRLPSVTVLYEKGDGQSAELFQTGELVQVGRVWKLAAGPLAGAAQPRAEVAGSNPVVVPEAARAVVAELQALTPPADPAEMPQYHARRAALLERVVAATAGEQQQPWLRQVIDAYTAAAASGGEDGPNMTRLKQWADKIMTEAAGSSAASYAAFRLLDAQYTARMTAATPQAAAGVQKWWREQLEGYVKAYPDADDAPEAMMRLAVAHEFAAGGEATAKSWYEKLAQTFPQDTRAAKAQGAVKRLQSEGQPLTLPPVNTAEGKPFDPAGLVGKPALVYYFANWSSDPTAEARVIDELKKLGEAAGSATVVTISLDDAPERGLAAVRAAGLKGVHLHAPGGLDRSPLATAYGIQMVPHLMLVDKAGKVADRNAQSGPGLAAQVEKLAK